MSNSGDKVGSIDRYRWVQAAFVVISALQQNSYLVLCSPKPGALLLSGPQEDVSLFEEGTHLC